MLTFYRHNVQAVRLIPLEQLQKDDWMWVVFTRYGYANHVQVDHVRVDIDNRMQIYISTGEFYGVYPDETRPTPYTSIDNNGCYITTDEHLAKTIMKKYHITDITEFKSST